MTDPLLKSLPGPYIEATRITGTHYALYGSHIEQIKKRKGGVLTASYQRTSRQRGRVQELMTPHPNRATLGVLI
jgi:hypothetical protein